MTPRAVALIFSAAMLAGLALPARADDACWQLVHKAILKSALSQRAPYVTYSEIEDISSDGNRFARSSALITYRDDGLAYVDDDRWVHPWIGYLLDPGPPVLGPYGDRRRSWLDLADNSAPMPVIASTHNSALAQCNDLGDEIWNGQKLAHLQFPDARVDRPALLGIWLDRTSLRVAHAVTRDWLSFWSGEGTSRGLVTYQIDVERIDGYDVLSRVSWEHHYRWYSQSTTMKGEYVFGNYKFASTPPTQNLFTSDPQ